MKRFIWLWLQCFKSLSPKTLLPFFVNAVIQIFVVYSLVNFIHSPFSKIFIPWIRRFFGEGALHYPNFYYAINPLYNQMSLIISGLFGIVIIGIATQLFATNFRGGKPSLNTAFQATMPRYGVLFLIWIIESVCVYATILGLPAILNHFLQPEYRISRIFDLGGVLLGILIGSVFAYTSAIVVLERQGLIGALVRTISIFKKNVFTSFFLIAVPTFIYFPISFILRKSNYLIAKFSPEIIAAIIIIGIIVSLFTSYIQIGTITRFYLFINERKRY